MKPSTPTAKSVILLTLNILLLASCANGGSAPDAATKPRQAPNFYTQDAGSQLVVTLFDPTGGKMGQTMATYVDGDIVCCPLSAVRGAHHAKAATLTEGDSYPVYGFTAFDFRTDIVFLRVGKRNNSFSRTCPTPIAPSDTIFGISANTEGKIFKTTLKQGQKAAIAPGAGVFDNAGRLRAIANADGGLVTARDIDSLLARQTTQHTSVYDLRLKTGRQYISHTKVAGFLVRTTMGNFKIRLFDDVPEYRDNFIKLVSDHYYDSLLVHRVLPSFLIQTGAADTKYAKPGDVIGWQGPGYTLPIIDNQKHFHKRAAVAASKLPPDRNPQNRCDGGQFYVVCGRRFSSAELDKIAREDHKTFTPAQRQAYATVGGAPHLDGDYVVFGEVTQGMDVVDAISRVELTGDKGDRPVKEVRILSLSLIRK
ncbi:MAG: peptidylprolyl isomerase [Bacteroidales bacterium]|nr:peptidylprolyl isomerase [Bacteroidales bacterium]